MRSLLCLIVALVFWSPGRSFAEVPKDELAKLQGTWSVTAASRNGKDVPEENRSKLSVVIKDATITIKTEKRDEAAEIAALDPSKKPATIDIKPPKEDKTLHGIYKLDGDTLEIAYSRTGPAPEAIAPGDDVSILKLARMKGDAVRAEEPADKKPDEKKTPDEKKPVDEKKE